MSSDDDTSRDMPPPPPPPGGAGPQGWDRSSPGSQDWQSSQGWGGDVAPRGPEPAGVGTRAVAYIIDSIIVGVANFIIGLIVIAPFVTFDTSGMTPFAGGGWGLASLVTTLIGAALTLAYFGFLEGNNNGRTLGKMVFNIRAVRANGQSLDVSDAVKRRLPFVIATIAGLVPWVGWIASLGIPIAILITAVQDRPWNRGWHDQYAGTMVVRS